MNHFKFEVDGDGIARDEFSSPKETGQIIERI
ncbi:MAG: hypothetical protein HLUCCA04_08295 [Oceanicaulis sp. HLUCCA04]|nr:MAG: hypothetical protein HLUCCA04_08295 [Oceanicaulis sp. HLUCCA04]